MREVRTWRIGVEPNGVRSFESRAQRLFDVATLVAAVLTLPVVVALALNPPADLETALRVANWVLWGAFALELVTMVAVSRSGASWLRHHPITPAVVLLTLPAFAGLDLFRLVRLLRGPAARRVAEGVTSAEGLRNVALLTLMTVGLGGVVFAHLEPGVGVGDGLYWAVTTVTTTGYGDVVPTTEAGKALAVMVMIVGAGFLAILTGAIAQRFVGRWRDSGEPGAVAASAGARDDAVLAKLDELGERLAQLEHAVTRGRG